MGFLLAPTGGIRPPCGQGFLKRKGMSQDHTQRRRERQIRGIWSVRDWCRKLSLTNFVLVGVGFGPWAFGSVKFHLFGLLLLSTLVALVG